MSKNRVLLKATQFVFHLKKDTLLSILKLFVTF